MTSPNIMDPAPVDLTAILARANGATPGPWLASPKTRFEEASVSHDGGDEEGSVAKVWGGDRVAIFIAASRTDVPAMAAEIDRLRALLAEALDGFEEASAYKPGNLAVKHGDADAIARLRAILPPE